MDSFVESVALEIYNKIVDITGDDPDIDYSAIEAAIELGCRVIWRYDQAMSLKLIDDINLLKRKYEKEEKEK